MYPQPPPDPSISTHSHPCLFQPDPSLDPESLLQPHVMDSAVTSPSPLRKLSTRRGCWRGCQDCPVRPLLRASSPFATPAGWFGARHTHTHTNLQTHICSWGKGHTQTGPLPPQLTAPSPLQPHQPHTEPPEAHTSPGPGLGTGCSCVWVRAPHPLLLAS